MTPDAPNPKPETPNAEQFLSPSRFALVLAALLAVTFWRVLFAGEAFFYRDYGFLGYPFAHFHRECFWSGDFFPLWNPYVNCGAPFLAQWNTLCLYPGALIYLLLPLPWSLGFFCVAHLFLGGMGMRALAERWTGSPFGAAVAGVAFVFSGLVLGCVIYPNYLVALGWMPWVVLATRRAWQEGGRSIVLAALAGAMQMLSGAPEIILLTWGFLAALLVVDWVQGSRFKVQSPLAQGSSTTTDTPGPLTPALSPDGGEGDRSAVSAACTAPQANTSGPLITSHFSLLTRYLSVIALITGLCAAQLLPFFQLLSLSQRSGDAMNTFWSLPGWGWVNLFFPLLMNFQTEQGVFVMIGQSFFPSVYLGIVPLTLALLAVWRVRTPEVKLLGAATLLAVLLAMGDNFVLWRWLREVLPLGIMRFPVKALLLAAFTVPLLAGYGSAFFADQGRRRLNAKFSPTEQDSWAAISRRLSRSGFWKPWLVIWAGAAALLLGAHIVGIGLPAARTVQRASLECAEFRLAALCWGEFALLGAVFFFSRHRTTAATMVMVAVVALDGASHLGTFNPTIPASAFEPGLAAAYHASKGALTPAPKLGESRIMLSPLAERALHTRMVPKFYDDFIGQRLAFWGNLNLLDGLPKVNGASTLVTREWNDVEAFLYGTTNPAPASLMDFLGVTHTTKPGELMQWERRTNAMPLVSAGQKIQPYAEGSQSVGALLGPNWNPREVVFIPANTSTNRAEQVAATARVRHFQPRAGDLQSPSASNDSNRRRLQTADTDADASSIIEIEAEAAAPTVVVIAQNHYPSWRATVNGQPAPVLRANHAFQAIPIPAGKSTIRLDYVDWPFRIGAVLSLATLLGCVVLWRRPRLN